MDSDTFVTHLHFFPPIKHPSKFRSSSDDNTRTGVVFDSVATSSNTPASLDHIAWLPSLRPPSIMEEHERATSSQDSRLVRLFGKRRRQDHLPLEWAD